MPKYANTSKYTHRENDLWHLLTELQGVFYTMKGIPYTYTIHENELFVSCKRKSITRACANKVYRISV